MEIAKEEIYLVDDLRKSLKTLTQSTHRSLIETGREKLEMIKYIQKEGTKTFNMAKLDATLPNKEIDKVDMCDAITNNALQDLKKREDMNDIFNILNVENENLKKILNEAIKKEIKVPKALQFSTKYSSKEKHVLTVDRKTKVFDLKDDDDSHSSPPKQKECPPFEINIDKSKNPNNIMWNYIQESHVLKLEDLQFKFSKIKVENENMTSIKTDFMKKTQNKVIKLEILNLSLSKLDLTNIEVKSSSGILNLIIIN